MPTVSGCSIIPKRRGKLRDGLWIHAVVPQSFWLGTILAREWNGRMHRVTVLADGFAWSGKTYPSLSKLAFAITGSRWNGPRFFGLRHKQTKTSPT